MGQSLWVWLMAASPVPVPWAAGAALVAGALVAAAPWSWRVTRLLAVHVHEAGHALAALLLGRAVRGIRLSRDGSGETVHAGRAGGLGLFVTSLAGYPAPAVLGLGVCAAVADGRAPWAIAAMAVVTVLLAPLQRSWRGALATLACAGGLWLLGQAPSPGPELALVALAGYLLMAGPRTIVELHVARRADRRMGAARHSDADALARQTHVPALVWEAVFALVCGACAWYAAVAVLAL